MENHPIPQDVTGFQFKLIGDMTLKQFAYLASGVILGWVFFSIPASALIRYPLALLFIGTGVSLAFLPIEGRPMDIMAKNFIRALFAPDLFLYQKIGGEIGVATHIQKAAPVQQPTASSAQKLQVYLQNIQHKPQSKLDEKESVFFQSISSYSQTPTPTLAVNPVAVAATPPAQVAPPPAPIHIPFEAPPPISDQPNTVEEKLREQTYLLQMRLNEAKKEEQTGNNDAHQKASILEQQLAQIQSQKQALEQQLLDLSQKLKQQSGPQVFTPSEGQVKQETMLVRKIPKGAGKSVGLPITPEFPNLLVGIVKDPRGNVLPNILVEVRDGQGNPVRAFKTNQLGQFASATPLLNGTYTLIFEDNSGKQKFDAVEIEAAGDVISPIEVISMDQREQLRKELFGG